MNQPQQLPAPEKVKQRAAKMREICLMFDAQIMVLDELIGKTIIFADRWFQCEQLRGFLEQHVSFIDNWQQSINWAEYDPLEETPTPDDPSPKVGERLPMQLISIDLVRQLVRQMDSGVNINQRSRFQRRDGAIAVVIALIILLPFRS